MSADVFVYYRISPLCAAQARRAVTAVFSEIRRNSGVSGRLMHRHKDETTWMEVYEPVADVDQFEKMLNTAALHAGLHQLTVEGSERKVEAFITDGVVSGGETGEAECA